MRHESFDTPGPLKVKVDIPSGGVELETVEGSRTEVELTGSEDLIQEARVELRPHGDGHELIVETHPRVGFRLFRSSSRGVGVKVLAPHGASVQISSASADVQGRGRFGKVEVDSASGDVTFEEIEGDAHANTASGKVEIGRLGGIGKFQSASGDVEVVEAGSSLKVQTASGDQEIGSVASGEVTLQSASGDIKIGVKRGSKLWIDARSMSGETSSELEVGEEAPEGEGSLVEVRATAMSGDVRVVRAG
ncbi:MAG: DUF4097 family beta strand repeat protein [Actinobacteria bacterium]|nr:DUF4097 family beta strand repeat protein [Actinomycetota bacterium]